MFRASSERIGHLPESSGMLPERLGKPPYGTAKITSKLGQEVMLPHGERMKTREV